MIKKIIMDKNFEKQKTILENFYRCRDLELNNLWQKSIFLGPFLILCFTGYGILLSSMISNGQKDTEVLFKYNFLCLALCLVSIIFSMLWIYMFKGSKAHYELYERAITDFEEKKLGIEKKFVMGRFYYNVPINECLFSTNGGNFSPSRINVFIGQISLILWILGGLVHLYKIISNHYFIKCLQEHQNILFFILIILTITFCSFIFHFINRNVKSSYLTTNRKKTKGCYEKSEYS